MSADTIFALVANVLGVPTLAYGLRVDFRSRSLRRRRHLRLLRRAIDAVEAAALNLLRTDLSGPGMKSPRLVAPRKRLYRTIDDLNRYLDIDLTPQFVWALNPELLREVSATECAERLGLWLAVRGHRDLRLQGFTEFARDLIEELDNLDRAGFELADLAAPGVGATEQQLAALEDDYRFSLMRARENAESTEAPEYVRNLVLRIPQLTRDNAGTLRHEVARLLKDSRSVLFILTDAKLWWRVAGSVRVGLDAYGVEQRVGRARVAVADDQLVDGRDRGGTLQRSGDRERPVAGVPVAGSAFHRLLTALSPGSAAVTSQDPPRQAKTNGP